MTDYYFILPEHFDLTALKNCVKSCENEVYFETTDGDNIALKSVLGQYLFLTIVQNFDSLSDAQIHCIGKADKARLEHILILRQ